MKKISHFISRAKRIPTYKKIGVLILLTVLAVSAFFGARYIKHFLTAQPVYKTNSPDATPLITRAENPDIIEPGSRALLPGAKWVPQSFNNCGPATTSMVLQYFGHSVDQTTTKSALRTNPDDKNVFTYEIQDYLKNVYGIESKLLFNGDRNIIKKLIANGFYVIAEDWLHPHEDIGHVTILRGFDDEQGVFIADDSFLGVNIIYKYDVFEETQWKAFNREYLPLYLPAQEEKVKEIIGENWDSRTMYEHAVEKAQQEIQHNNRDTYAYFNLGTSYFALGEYEKAADAFTEAKTIGWPRRMLWYQIQPVQTLNALGQYHEALTLADEGLWENDAYAEMHVEKAIAYTGLGDSLRAKEEIQKALQYAPNLQSARDFEAKRTDSGGIVDDSGQVLGVSYFGPVAGSPLIPPEVVTIYFVVFLGLLLLIYIVLHRQRRPVLVWHKVKLFLIVAVLLKVVLIGGGTILAGYWLLPRPNIHITTPSHEEMNYRTNQKLEIIFDRPVNRSMLKKTISPEVPGVWLFENALYSTHFYRKVTFVPTQSLSPETTYTITLADIQNSLKTSQPYTESFSFKTQSPPRVASVFPVHGTDNVSIDTPLTVMLSEANNAMSEFEFVIEPKHPVRSTIDMQNKRYVLTPQLPWKQGTSYTITIKKSDIVLNLPTNTVIERGNSMQEYQGTFTTKEPPGIAGFSPETQNASPSSQIVFSFSEAMNKKSVEEHFTLIPEVPGRITWPSERKMQFIPSSRLAYETTYTAKITIGAKSQAQGFFDEDVVKTFTTIGTVKVAQFSPSNSSQAVGVSNQIKITFDQDVDKKSAESKFTINPEVSGTFSWEGRTMIFAPNTPFGYSTQYTVQIASGVKTIRGLDSNKNFVAIFTTQEQTVKLAVPAYLQRYSLSCEIASLRMALAHKGVSLSEDEILAQLGVDPTPHTGNIWGNPHSAFVGNVNGRQMADGYGVHWEPIARVARTYRNAQDFQHWDIAKLTEALSQNHAVVIWVYSGGGYPTSWMTPDGKSISAYRDEHAVTAVGYMGPAHNPSQLIINDPLTGQVYWPRAYFDKKWKSFGNAGVVVY